MDRSSTILGWCQNPGKRGCPKYLIVLFSILLLAFPLGATTPRLQSAANLSRRANAPKQFSIGKEAPSLTQQEQVVQMLSRGRAGLEQAVRILRTRSDPRLKEVAVYVIGKYGNEQLTKTLAGALTDPSDQIRRSAIAALQKLLNPEGLTLNPKGDTLVLPPPPSLPPDRSKLCSALRPLLKDSSPLIRSSAAETTGWLLCRDSLPELEELLHDQMEPVRFFASRAIHLLTGKNPNFINLGQIVWGDVPSITIGKAEGNSDAQQAGPFLRTAFFEKQGKFSYRGGIPAQFQTVLRIWWNQTEIEFAAVCQDKDAHGDKADSITFLVRPGKKRRLYSFKLVPGRGLIKQAVLTTEGKEKKSELKIAARVGRSRDSWQAELAIPFSAFGLHQAPLGEIWQANAVRVESHHATGWGPEISSWVYFDRDSPGPPWLGFLIFANNAPVVTFRPPIENIYVFPYDQDSLPQDQNQPHNPTTDELWGDIVPPDHLVRGVNSFFLALKSTEGKTRNYRAMLTAYGYEDRKIIAKQSQSLRLQATVTTQRLEINIPEAVLARSIDLEMTVSGTTGGQELFRNRFICVPLIDPPARVVPYHLSIVRNEGKLWREEANGAYNWKIRDYGPMLMTESYPMALAQTSDGIIYGGTYPGGRLFSFNPSTGRVRDLGSPGPPANHLYNLVISSEGSLFGDLYRPYGKIFSYDPRTGKSVDLGVPVRGSFSGWCKVMATVGGRVYGTQRGRLFYFIQSTGQVVDRGNFLLGSKRYLPSQISSDAAGNLLGIAGGYLFRYQPKNDEVLISDSKLDGWLLSGPGGKVYALRRDGELFEWESDRDRLVEVARYPQIPPRTGPEYKLDPYRGALLVLTQTGELVTTRSGIDDPSQNIILVCEPGATHAINLGNPVPNALYLTGLATGTDGRVYGLSTQTVYGLGRTPVHLYSLRRTTHQPN